MISAYMLDQTAAVSNSWPLDSKTITVRPQYARLGRYAGWPNKEVQCITSQSGCRPARSSEVVRRVLGG